MKFMILIMGGSLMALAATCGENSIIDRKLDTSVIMPLQVGRNWSGIEVSRWYNSDSATTRTLSYSVTDTFTVSGEKWFVIKWSPAPDFYDIDWSFTNRKDGLWVDWTSPEDRSYGNYPIPYAKYPVAIETRYDGISVESHVRVIAVDTSIIVPAGKFKCYGYSWFNDQSSDSGVVFLSPGTGWVKKVHYAMKGPMMPERTIVWELSELKR